MKRYLKYILSLIGIVGLISSSMGPVSTPIMPESSCCEMPASHQKKEVQKDVCCEVMQNGIPAADNNLPCGTPCDNGCCLSCISTPLIHTVVRPIKFSAILLDLHFNYSVSYKSRGNTPVWNPPKQG